MKALGINEPADDESTKRLLAALNDLLWALPTDVSCENFHHHKHEQHHAFNPCSVLQRYIKARDTADEVACHVMKREL